MDPGRRPCCIRGCRRTLPAERFRDSSEVMCGKHARCDRQLLALLKQAGRVVRKLRRRYPHIGDPFDECWNWKGPGAGRTVGMAMRAAWTRFERRWKALVVEAQRQQDAGFFAPKPRRRSKPEPIPVERHAGGFEREFQRLKAITNGLPAKPARRARP